MRNLLILFLLIIPSVTAFSQTDPTSEEVINNVMSLEWSPEGKGLYFTVIQSDKERKRIPRVGIFYLDLSSGTVTQIVTNAMSPNISSNGKKLAYVKIIGHPFTGKSDIYYLDLERQLEVVLLSDEIKKSEPCWSHDGTKMTYSTRRNLERGPGKTSIDLWVYDLKTNSKKQITQYETERSFSPCFSPNGKKIVYYLEKGDNRDQIYITDIDGKRHKNLTADTTTHNFYPSWCGDKILYTQSPGQIMLITSDGKRKQKIENLDNVLNARFNKATNSIAYLTNRTKDDSLPKALIYSLTTKTSSPAITNDMLSGLEF
jgi:Tol biopolymer transport system component